MHACSVISVWSVCASMHARWDCVAYCAPLSIVRASITRARGSHGLPPPTDAAVCSQLAHLLYPSTCTKAPNGLMLTTTPSWMLEGGGSESIGTATRSDREPLSLTLLALPSPSSSGRRLRSRECERERRRSRGGDLRLSRPRLLSLSSLPPLAWTRGRLAVSLSRSRDGDRDRIPNVYRCTS